MEKFQALAFRWDSEAQRGELSHCSSRRLQYLLPQLPGLSVVSLLTKPFLPDTLPDAPICCHQGAEVPGWCETWDRIEDSLSTEPGSEL